MAFSDCQTYAVVTTRRRQKDVVAVKGTHMRDTQWSPVGSWIRACVRILLVVLAYSVTSAIVYFLWSRFIGWPVVSDELGEVSLRLIHLLPALACALVAAGIGAAINRVDKPLFPATMLAFGVGLIHYSSYSRLSRTSFGDIAAAAIESAILSVLTFASFWVVAGRLRRRARIPK
jgi:hypothetical protein